MDHQQSPLAPAETADASAEPALVKRILFVDDEQGVLSGIRRLLHGSHLDWDLHFALGGQAALDQLDTRTFDVVVSDMRMPGMDGAAVLAAVRARQPRAVRIILSGYADKDSVLRAVPVAHQYLTKPCDPVLLEEAVHRATTLSAWLTEPYLQDTLGKIDGLPSRPQMYHALTTAVADPNVSLNTVVAIIEGDSGMSLKVLQLVNSAFFGNPRAVPDVASAISCIGLSTLQSLVLTTEVFRGMGSHDSTFPFEAAEQHALLTAQIARGMMAVRTEGDQAFLAGLLHDVGTLLLAVHRPQLDGAKMERPPSAPPNPALHSRVAAYILSLWGLPHAISEAVANHHEPSIPGYSTFDLTGVVHVADGLAREQIGMGRESEESLEPFDTLYLDRVGVTSRMDVWRELAARTHDAGGQR